MSKTPATKEVRRLYDLGFAIHWLHAKSKRPIESKWTTGPRKSWAELEKSARAGMNVGVRLGEPSKVGGGYLAVIDCDVKSSEEKHLEEMRVKLKELFPDARTFHRVDSGRGGGSCHFYFLTAEPVSPKRLAQSADKVKVRMPSSVPSRAESAELSPEELATGIRLRAAWEISLMGDGQQVVLPPSIHPDTGRAYSWARPLEDADSLQLIEVAGMVKPKAEKTDSKGFKAVAVDLISSRLPSAVVDQIMSGKGVEDRSAALLGVTNKMVKVGMSDDEILSVLTDPDHFLGGVAYEHAKTESRSRAAEWIRRYTLEKSKREVSAASQFEAEVEIGEPLSDEQAEEQAADVVPLPEDWRELIERSGEQAGFRPKNTLKNVILILKGEGGAGVLKRDEFANAELYGVSAPWGSKAGAEVSDIDVVRIKKWLAEHYRFEPSDDRIWQAISAIADENRFHPVRDYLDTLEWDGKPRLDTWLKDYLNAEAPEPYLSAVSRKVLCAMVARIYRPGTKFDYVLILEGFQGVGKSTALRNLAGDAWFSDAEIDVSDKDAVMTMRSKWLIELGELSGMRSADVELLKAFVSRTEDRIRVPYGKRAENFPRQCIFIGSTNRDEYLKDPTGNRRFWPVKVGACDFKQLELDRDQLFAEAKIAWGLGEPLYLESPDMVKAAVKEQEARTVRDSFDDLISDWLSKGESDDSIEPASPRDRFRTVSLFEGGGPLSEWKANQQEVRRASEALRKLGFSLKLVWDTSTKRPERLWVKT
jgi:predicted P-loop ATPase